MKVRIYPNQFLNPGTCERTLGELGVGPILQGKDGSIRCEMTQAQRDLFGIRGASHRLEIIPDAEPGPAPAPEPEHEPADLAPPAAPSVIIASPTGNKTVEFKQPEHPKAFKPDTSKLEADPANIENLGGKPA